MAATAPWSIKGIDAKTRKMVKSQAQKSDMTMGEWLSDAVNMAVLKQYIAAPEIEYEDQKNDNKFNAKQNADTYQNVDTMKNSSNRARYSRKHNHLNPAPHGYDSHPEKQVSKGFNVIENALTDIVDHIELVDGNNSKALRDMQAQIAQLNARAKNKNTPEAHSLHQEFGDMEGRLANLADRIDELNENSTAFATQVQDDVQTWVDDQDDAEEYEQNVMSSRFDELFIKLDNISHQQSNYGNSVKYLELGMKNQLDQISTSLRQTDEPQANDYDEEIGQMEEKLSALSERLDSSLNDPAVDPQIAELEQQIGGLSQKLADLLSAPEPEYSPVPTTPIQSAESSVEISELRDSIAQINLRLEKTEDRLSGIDRLEDNMGKLIASVADIRANSHDVAQDAATAAIEAFAKKQQDAEQAEDNDKKDQADIDAMIATKFAEITEKNSASEKTHLSGFKTVEKSLEKIMNRLSRVEDGQHRRAAPIMAPPDPQANLMEAEQDFIQPGADTKAEQPQDITAQNSKLITPETAPEPVKLDIIEPVKLDIPAPAVISEPIPEVAQPATRPTAAMPTIETPTIATSNIEPKPAAMPSPIATPPSSIEAKQQPRIEASPQVMPEAEMPVEAMPVEPMVDLTAAGPVGIETADTRPVAQPSSSTDFIAAARRAAQQSYENDKGTDVEAASGMSESLFSKIKNAAKRDKKQNNDEPQILSRFEETAGNVAGNVVDVVARMPDAMSSMVAGKDKKKFSLPKFSFKKKAITEPVMQKLPNHYTPDLATDIFEEDFFTDVDVPAQAALKNTAGNELGQKARDESKTKTNRKGAAPVVIALFMVTVIISGVSWYSLKGGTRPASVEQALAAQQAAQAQPKVAAAPENIALNEKTASGQTAINQAAAQNKGALAILKDAKVDLNTGTNGTKLPEARIGFTPQEFEKLPNATAQTRTPTAKQIEALKKDGDLVTNSIPKLSSKSYSTSLLGNNSKFSKSKDTSRVGSSSLSKSPRVKTVASVNSAKPSVMAAVEELPAKIGPKLLRQNAQIGQVAEQFEIANRYALGYGVDIDLAKSYNWFVKAADNKLAVAQFSVGMMLEHGKGTTRNLDQARKYYQYAAEQGNLMSIYRLAMMNAAPQNPTIKPDFKVALKWFNMAANAGLVDAQYNLAVLYEKGHGTDVDLVETYKWYSIAGNKGDKQAKKRAEVIKLELSTSQVLQAQNAVKAWKVAELPANANQAPKLNYLKNEALANNTKIDQSPHLKTGTLATDLIADKKSIKDTQKMLGELGWNVGPLDGIMGAKTRKAIKEFQTRHNLTATGQVNDELLANLEAATL